MKFRLDAEGRDLVAAVAAAAERSFGGPGASPRARASLLTEPLAAVRRLLAWARGERSRLGAALEALPEEAQEWLLEFPSQLVEGRLVEDGVGLAHALGEILDADQFLGGLAVTLAECGHRERAIAEAEACLARFPHSPWAAVACGEAWHALGDVVRAEELLRRGLALARNERQPGDPSLERDALDGALECLLPLLLGQGREAEARELFRRHAAPLRLERTASIVPIAAVRAGRNDPCPCGSGRKYKRCCGSTLLEEAPAPDFSALLEQVVQFDRMTDVSDPSNAVVIAYFGEPDGRLEDDNELAAFVEWKLLDFRDALGRTAVERFLDWRAEDLDAPTKSLLEALVASQLRLYEIRAVRPGEGLTLFDLLDGRTIEVRERLGSRSVERWDLLAARTFPSRGATLLAGGILALGAARKEELLAALSTELDRIRHERPGLPEAELHALAAGVFQRHRAALREQPLPQLMTSDGEEMVFCTARYTVRDAAEVRRRLAASRQFDPDGRGREFVWIGTRNGGPVLGHLKLTPQKLRLDCNSRERLERGRKLLAKLLGDLVWHRGDAFESVAEKLLRERVRKERDGDRGPEHPAPGKRETPATRFRRSSCGRSNRSISKSTTGRGPTRHCPPSTARRRARRRATRRCGRGSSTCCASWRTRRPTGGRRANATTSRGCGESWA